MLHMSCRPTDMLHFCVCCVVLCGVALCSERRARREAFRQQLFEKRKKKAVRRIYRHTNAASICGVMSVCRLVCVGSRY